MPQEKRVVVGLRVVFLMMWIGLASIAPRALGEAPRAMPLGLASLSDMGKPKKVGNALVFSNEQGSVSLSLVAADVARVRFARGAQFDADHSFTVVSPLLGSAEIFKDATFTVGESSSVIASKELRIVAQHNPFRVMFTKADGTLIDSDDPVSGISYVGKTVRVTKRLAEDAHVYGLGEKNGRLDKRGLKLGGYAYTMWNSDTFSYGQDTDPIYVSVPFFIVLEKGRAHGIFFDNTFRSSFDIGHQSQDLLSFGATGGELNYYLIAASSPKQVVRRYSDLTGHAPLPPRWALGFHQSRYSYLSQTQVLAIASGFRARKIPADTIWLDIDYQDGYKPFTWDRSRFPDPKGMITKLRTQGFRVVTIVDGHPKKEVGYYPYDSGIKGDFFVKNPDGSVYEGPVWPSQALINPASSVFPDFSNPAARRWWGGLYAPFLQLGVAGIWNDMNEPAVFVEPTGTMPRDLRHQNDGHPTTHEEIHNVYGMQMLQSTFEGLQRLQPNERPFILGRASFAGGQKYAANWTGDAVSSWPALRGSISTLLGMGLSGMPFVGADIGGFVGGPSAELFTRWLQTGVFYPFMRDHTNKGNNDQEPWAYEPPYVNANRRAIELRYELLPYIYTTMKEASTTGIPAMRPLMLEFPADPATATIDDEFMFGQLLVAPVLSEHAKSREVYLPAGTWYDYWSGLAHVSDGKQLAHIVVPVSLASIPLFVREGSFLYQQPVVQHTGQMEGMPLIIKVYPSSHSEGDFYDDDGKTTAYQQGVWAERHFVQTRKGGVITLTGDALRGSYQSSPRDLIIEFKTDVKARRVTLDGKELSYAHLGDLARMKQGWTMYRGFIQAKFLDRAAAFSVRVD